jgi:hypothetical protein
VKDHTPATLQGAARALGTSLATLQNSAALAFSPKLRQAIPLLSELLEALADTGDRVTIIEQNIARLQDRITTIEAMIREEQGLGGSIERWIPTLDTQPPGPASIADAARSIDFNLDDL